MWERGSFYTMSKSRRVAGAARGGRRGARRTASPTPKETVIDVASAPSPTGSSGCILWQVMEKLQLVVGDCHIQKVGICTMCLEGERCLGEVFLGSALRHLSKWDVWLLRNSSIIWSWLPGGLGDLTSSFFALQRLNHWAVRRAGIWLLV